MFFHSACEYRASSVPRTICCLIGSLLSSSSVPCAREWRSKAFRLICQCLHHLRQPARAARFPAPGRAGRCDVAMILVYPAPARNLPLCSTSGSYPFHSYPRPSSNMFGRRRHWLHVQRISKEVCHKSLSSERVLPARSKFESPEGAFLCRSFSNAARFTCESSTLENCFLLFFAFKTCEPHTCFAVDRLNNCFFHKNVVLRGSRLTSKRGTELTL